MASTIDQTTPGGDRAHQAFPELDGERIDRMRPFADERRYADGELLFEAGAPGPGLFVVTRGEVAVTRRDGLGGDVPVVTQGVGQFLAEVGQLSAKPALVDGRAVGEVEALLLAPEALRTLLVAASVTVIDALLALPVAFYMAKVARPFAAKALVVSLLMPLWARFESGKSTS